MKKSQQFRIAKYEGDDRYSWALFEHGRPCYTGMSRDEAAWRLKEAKAKGKVT